MTALLADIIARKDAQSKAHVDRRDRQKALEVLLAEVVSDHADELEQIFREIKYYGMSVEFRMGGYRYAIAFDSLKSHLNVGFEANTAGCGYMGVQIPYDVNWPNSKMVATFKQAIRAVTAKAYRGKHYN